MLRIICLTVIMLMTVDIKAIVPVIDKADIDRPDAMANRLPIDASQRVSVVKENKVKIKQKKVRREDTFEDSIKSKEKKLSKQEDIILINSSTNTEQKNNVDGFYKTSNKKKEDIKNEISDNSKKNKHQENELAKSVVNIESATKNSKKITILNSITPEKTAYSHWSGTYTPEFTVTVDGAKINMGDQEVVEVYQQKITVKYDAQFPANHSSQEEFVIDIIQNTETIILDFDWQAKPRLQIKQTSFLKNE